MSIERQSKQEDMTMLSSLESAGIAPEGQPRARPTLSKLFLVWARISVESFGGGSSTLLLMRREFVEKQRWFTAEEYGDYWSISQMSPGIVLLAMSIMMGWELR